MSLFKLVLSVLIFNSLATAETKNVGAILPLSGGGASYGVACKNGIEMGLNDFKEKIGDRFKVVYEDDQNVPAQTVSALRKLRNTNKIDFVLTFSSSTSNAIAPLVDKGNFILVALATDPNVSKGRKNAFNYWVTPEEEVKLLISELNRRNIRRIAIFATQHEGVLAATKAFKNQVENTSIEILFEEEFAPSDKDFRTALTKVSRLKNLDGIFNLLYIDQVGILPKQARDLGMRVPVFNWELYECAAVLDSAQGSLEGQFFVTASVGIKEFEKTFKKKYPDSSLIAAANCYDYIGLLATTPELTVEGFRHHLETLKDYPGAAGLSSAAGNHLFTLPGVVKEIRGKEFVTLDR